MAKIDLILVTDDKFLQVRGEQITFRNSGAAAVNINRILTLNPREEVTFGQLGVTFIDEHFSITFEPVTPKRLEIIIQHSKSSENDSGSN